MRLASRPWSGRESARSQASGAEELVVASFLTWYDLKLMSFLGLVRDLKPVPARVLARAER